jgi:periplasmic protein TonB
MKRNNRLSSTLLSAVVISSLIFLSCTDNETSETPTPTTSAETITDTATATPPIVQVDTTTKKGTAIPDSTKRGKKGKASVRAEMPAKNAGAKVDPDETGLYGTVDIIPSFAGGNKGLQNYFDKNLDYPAEANDAGVDGTVRISFIVDENGKLISPMVVGENLGYGLDEEALRVVNKMPAWTPAKVKGKSVKTRVILPIKFELM